ncbi:MAG TPA: alpha/beta fold hydrolase, partial [Thermomicrobiales bacterium]
MSSEPSSRPPTIRTTVAGRALRAFVLLSMVWALGFTALPTPTVAATAAAPTPITTGVPRFEAGPCVYTLGEGQVEGQTVNCGFVVTAAKHANAGGATVRLPVAVFKSTSATPAAEATILLTGGPGQSGQVFATTLTTEAPFTAFYNGVAANNDVIVFDQRGTGKSEPALQCPEASGMTEQGLYVRAFADSPLVTAMNKCRDRLTAAGIDLSAFTTTENAADVNDIRLALGYPAINIIGGSYGSELGLAVARDFGQFVRTNNLVSIVPIQTPWFFEQSQSFDRAIKELFRDCAANTSCNAANPNLQAAFQTTVAKLNDTPYPLRVKDPASGQTIELPLDGVTYTALLFQLFYDSSILPFMPDIITRSSRGDFVWLENLLPLLFGENTDPLALGMHFSIVCSKNVSQERLNASLEANKNVLPEVRAALEPQNFDYFNICQNWPSKDADPKGNSPAVSDRPTTLISGQFDPITQPQYADIAKQTLPNAVSVTLPGGGHSAILPVGPVGTCGFTVAVSNIANPGKPDISCVGALRTTYRTLPSSIAGGPTPSPTPAPSASPRPSASPTPVPSA